MNNLKKYSLVLYRGKPAVITAIDDKISILLENNSEKKVRIKDLIFLCEGPVRDFAFLNEKINGDIQLAWELLSSEESVSISELAELIYGEITPASLWQTYLELQKNELFYGDCNKISAYTEEEVKAKKEEMQKKQKAAEIWDEYIGRIKTGTVMPQDIPYLKEVELLAYEKAKSSKTLKSLSIPQEPDKALILLKKLKVLPDYFNPYPIRNNLLLENHNFAFDATGIMNGRLDLTGLKAYAVDDEGCTDPDDAISLDGDFIWVHIADPSAVIKPEDLNDQRAENKGVSYYLPEFFSPMLPDSINRFFALGLQEKSPALSVKLSLDEQGHPKCEQIVFSIIKAEQISYQQADRLLETEPFKTLINKVKLFNAMRLKSGALEFDIPDVKLKVKLPGNFEINRKSYIDSSFQNNTETPEIDIKTLPNSPARKLISEIMQMTGNAVAQWLVENKIPAPFISQPPPEDPFQPSSLPEMFQLCRQMKRSEVHIEPGFHAGLGLECYTRVTSPLRRYTDLLVHYQIRAYLTGSELLSENDMLRKMSYSEEQSQNAAKVEKMSNLHWKIYFLKLNPDKKYRAVYIESAGVNGNIFIPELSLSAKVKKCGNLTPGNEIYCSPIPASLETCDLYPVFSFDSLI